MKWRIKLPSLSFPKWTIEPPSPWVVLALIVSTISAIFSAFNYFKSPPKARAALVIERFEDKSGPVNWPDGSQKTMHQLRMWFKNNGLAPATIRNVVVNPEYWPGLMTPEQESQRMDYTAKNKAMIGITPRGAEVVTGQEVAYPSNSAVPNELWSDFTNNKQILYVFAVISFFDEYSGDREVVTEICIRLDTSLNSWNHCFSGHNETRRP